MKVRRMNGFGCGNMAIIIILFFIVHYHDPRGWCKGVVLDKGCHLIVVLNSLNQSLNHIEGILEFLYEYHVATKITQAHF